MGSKAVGWDMDVGVAGWDMEGGVAGWDMEAGAADQDKTAAEVDKHQVAVGIRKVDNRGSLALDSYLADPDGNHTDRDIPHPEEDNRLLDCSSVANNSHFPTFAGCYFLKQQILMLFML